MPATVALKAHLGPEDQGLRRRRWSTIGSGRSNAGHVWHFRIVGLIVLPAPVAALGRHSVDSLFTALPSWLATTMVDVLEMRVEAWSFGRRMV